MTATIYQLRCFFSRFTDSPCDGRLDPCHLIPQQTIKDAGKKRGWNEDFTRIVLNDRRNIRTGCRQHHGLHDRKLDLRLTFPDYPVDTREFANEHGFVWDPVRSRFFAAAEGPRAA